VGEILRVALGSIAANPFRAVLTMLGVVIGVGSVITMLALGRGAQRAVDEQLATLGTNLITVTTGMRFAQGVARDQQLLTIANAQALARHGGQLMAAVPEQSGRQQLKLGNRNLNLNVIGTTPQHAGVNGFTLEAGRGLAAADGRARRRVAVLGGEVAQQLATPATELVGRTVLIRAIGHSWTGWRCCG
jgi:ABC-type antimicrobial peptide transport system permease subunit